MTVGAWQVLSLVPGTSRSGATILGGMMCGMSRPCASQFTFFLAIPVMAGASALKLFKFFLEGNALTGNEVIVLLVGCVVAFLVSMLAIRFLMDYVKRHTFTVFGWYPHRPGRAGAGRVGRAEFDEVTDLIGCFLV